MMASLGERARNAARKPYYGLTRARKRLRKTISLRDLYAIPRLAMQGFVAWVLPQSLRWRLSRLLGWLYVATHPKWTRRRVARIGALLGSTQRAREIEAEIWANWYEERFQYLRAWRPGGWDPRIDIDGVEHVRAALAKGRGIVFWGSNFAFNDLVAKMAMHRLGVEAIAFSVPVHGMSTTRFGIRYLNRIYRDIEKRYLRERIMAKPGQFPAVLAHMRDWLAENGVVYFTVGGRGRRTATAQFLEGSLIIATGPVAMAHRAGAALLPLYTLRTGSGRFEVTIGPPVKIPEDRDGKPDCDAAVQAYADALVPFVLRDPGQWRGWQLTERHKPWV